MFDASKFTFHPESASRALDNMVAKEEMPYGYTDSPPPADSGNFDMQVRNSKKEYPAHHRNK